MKNLAYLPSIAINPSIELSVIPPISKAHTRAQLFRRFPLFLLHYHEDANSICMRERDSSRCARTRLRSETRATLSLSLSLSLSCPARLSSPACSIRARDIFRPRVLNRIPLVAAACSVRGAPDGLCASLCAS